MTGWLAAIAGVGLGSLVVGALGFRPAVRWWVRRRLGPYRRQVAEVDPSLPERLDRPRRAVVVGGGLAGVGAAVTLARRGFQVELLEANPYLGGKLASWPATASDGTTVQVEHGFHAFFRHYYNLDRFLTALGIRQTFRAIPDYLILTKDGGRQGFEGLETTPILNLLDLGRRGAFRFREVLSGPAAQEMGALLEYDPVDTFAQLDHVSYAAFAERAALPASLKLSFNTFARAFFASEDRLSMAELVKSFHFYFLSQDAGLVYDHPVQDHATSLWAPIRAHLESLGVRIRPSTRVDRVERDGDGFRVAGERWDAVVLATPAGATRAIAEASPFLAAEAPEGARRLAALRSGQRYAVLRLWLDGPVAHDGPGYFVVERRAAVDAIAFYHRIEDECRAWSEETGGSVIELHSYAIPDEIPDAAVRDTLVADWHAWFPEATGRRILREHLYAAADFTAFHLGMDALRPTSETGVPGLVVAGDWVKLPFPSMLMEAAFTSGVWAANALLAREGLRREEVWSVPPRGVLHGLRPPPRRNVTPV
jgi:isorenieratene synthase